MKKLFFLTSLVILLTAFSTRADYVKKGAFICKSSELLNEMTSIAVKIADAKMLVMKARQMITGSNWQV